MHRGPSMLALALLGAWWPGGSAAAAPPVELKIATLAPSGSGWAAIMNDGARQIQRQTGGRVKVRFYFGGQRGDEREVVTQMTNDELDGAALTAIGLALINGHVRVLELPFLFSSVEQFDYVRERLVADFERGFDAAGYVVVSWGDVGEVHLYSQLPLRSIEDLGTTRIWAWADDLIVQALFKRLGVNYVPLPVPDVPSAFESGRINACYTSPLAAVALGWHEHVRFATEDPISYSIGALVVRKSEFERLSLEDRAVVVAIGRKMGAKLTRSIRKDNAKAKRAMRAHGVKFLKAPSRAVEDFEREGQAIWDELAGNHYPAELLQRAKQYRDEAARPARTAPAAGARRGR